MVKKQFQFKLILLGDTAVGKTSIKRHFLGHRFSDNYLMTLGVDFTVKKFKLDEEKEVKLQIWDLAGQDDFNSIRSRFLSNASAAFLVFDLTREQTIDHLDHWMKQLVNSNYENLIHVSILGNKNDLTDKIVVSDSNIEAILVEFRNKNYQNISTIDYFETSAKTGYNVDSAFIKICEKLVEDQ